MPTFPTDVPLARMRITTFQPAFTTTSPFTLTRYGRSTGAHQFQIDISTIDLDDRDRRNLRGFLAPLGSVGVFDFIPPVDGDSLGTVTGLITSELVHNIGDTVIEYSGSGDFAVGDIIKFLGHSKAYEVTSQVTGTINIWPPLLNGVAAGEEIIYKDVPILVVNDDPQVVNELTGNGGFSPVSLRLIESV